VRCISCARLSWRVICDRCRRELFATEIHTRTIGTLDVISFYHYTTLEPLLLTKHKPEGYRVYKALSKMLLRPFIGEFVESLGEKEEVYIIGVDEVVKSGYSHVALLTHGMKMPQVRVQHGALLAQNRVSYAGKPLQYRLDHPRDFRYRGKRGVDVILVDDIVTTGITLQEAQKVLLGHGVNVLFALTLADASE